MLLKPSGESLFTSSSTSMFNTAFSSSYADANGGHVSYLALKAFSASRVSPKSGKRSGYALGSAIASETAWFNCERSAFHRSTTFDNSQGQYVRAKNAASGKRLAWINTY